MQRRDGALLHGPYLQQGVDKKPIALCGRHSPGGGVWRGQKPAVLQFGHDVTDGCGTDREAALALQVLGSHWLPLANVYLHESF